MTLEDETRVYTDYKQKCAEPISPSYEHPSSSYCCNPPLTKVEANFLESVFLSMSICHYATMLILEFINGLSTSFLKICAFPQPVDVLKVLSRFPLSNDYSSSFYC